ncbi:MAG: PAS domain S-box protein [Syntrophobacteraceae bacterium]|jgi:PAS domain S-box-containing protein|nr:PAS domain S-box protein [Syntrophobacteraceae bacterium]
MDPCRILVVEDEAVVAMDIEERLRRLGYEVAGHAVSGEEAISLAASRLPDLVLMDIRLRGAMDGIAAADEMRRRFSLPIVFLTAFSEDETLDRAKRIEPSGFILKPFKDSELKSAIEIAVYKHRAEAQLRRMTRLFNTLSQVNQAIVRSRGTDELLQAVCRVVVEHGGIDLAWIGWVDTTASRIVPVAHFGKGGDRLQAFKVDLHEGIAEANGTARAIREDGPFVCREDASGCCPFMALSGSPEIRHVFRSCGFFPLHGDGRVCGTLNVCTSDPGFLGEREVELFLEVASDISFALDKHNADVEREKAEKALRVSESRYRRIVETANEGIWEMDGRFLTTYVNSNMAEMLGYETSEMLGRPVSSFMVPEDLEDHQQEMSARVKGLAGDYLRRFKHKGGSEVWTRVNSTAIMDDQGGFQGSFGMFTNITAQKRAEDGLRESENSLRALFDAVSESLFVFDTRGRILSCNPTFAERLNRTPEELVGECIFDHLNPEVAARRREWVKAVVEKGSPANFEDQRNGRWLYHTISPIRDSRGEVHRLVAFAVDLTRQKQTEDELRASKEFLDRILDSISDPIFVKDSEHRFVLFNQALCEWAGSQREHMLGRTDYDFFPGEQADVFWSKDDEVMESGRESINEEAITDAAGRARWLITRKNRYIDPSGNRYVVGVIHDVTERKRAEDIRQARIRLMNLALRSSMDELLQATLDEVEILTGSLIGFCHFLNADQETLSLQAWSTRTRSHFCRAEGKGLHYGVDQAGVWVDCIHQRRAVIHNDYEALPHRKGMPPGHARVSRQLVVPVLRGDRIVAILGVGNKPSGYDDVDVDTVSHLADLAWDIAEHKMATEAMAERDRSMRTLLENLPGAVYRCGNDRDWTMELLSQGCKALTGYACDDLIGNRRLSTNDLVHPDDRERLWGEWQEAIAQKRAFQGEYRITDASGEVKWVWESGSPIFDDTGTLLALEGFIMDISNRRRAEESLRESEARYRSVVEDAPMMISTYLPDTTLLFVNDACCGYFGRSREELIGRRFVEWLPESEGKRFHTLIAQLSPEEPTMVWEHEFISSEGTQCFHRWTNRAIFDCDDKPVLYQGFGEDITDQKRSRADLQRLATAIDQAGETVLITDARGVIQYVNPAFERTTGYAREEAIGRTPRILKSGQQDEAFYDEIWKTLLAGDVWEGRFTNRRKDGSLFQEEAVISPVLDPEGRITQFVAVKRDVSREVELETRLRQVQKMEAVGQLAGGVAHDFNNMLSPILGYAEMLLNDLHPADNRYDQVAQIKKAAERSRDLTRQLLAFSRKQVLRMKTVVLSEIVNNMEKLLRRTLREDIHLHTIPTSTPCSVMADVGQLEQVLMNLVVNAQDAMPAEGNLTIEVSRVELTEEDCAKTPGITPGRYGILTVRDTGSGMDRETLEHIFEPFYSTKGERGTGLGLATVYGVVKQHRGHILVESEPGRGTTFQVFLPEAEASVSLPERAQKTPLRVSGHESILVVEDDEMVLRMACTILMRHGYEVLHASSGIEALHLLERHEGPVHLLLTDVVMPEMNGRELCEMLAQRMPGLKVLYMSGYTDDVIACHGLLEEGTYLIHKPFSVHELPARVREVLDS